MNLIVFYLKKTVHLLHHALIIVTELPNVGELWQVDRDFQVIEKITSVPTRIKNSIFTVKAVYGKLTTLAKTMSWKFALFDV